jgi:hypothetical protein
MAKCLGKNGERESGLWLSWIQPFSSCEVERQQHEKERQRERERQREQNLWERRAIFRPDANTHVWFGAHIAC